MSKRLSSKWTAQTEWMRENGVTAAQWSNDGQLLACTLGPKPPPPADETKAHVPLNEYQQRIERRRIALAAGAQLVRRDG